MPSHNPNLEGKKMKEKKGPGRKAPRSPKKATKKRYRPMAPGETIRIGDQCRDWSDKKWLAINADDYVRGHKYDPIDKHTKFRRLVTPKTPIRKGRARK